MLEMGVGSTLVQGLARPACQLADGVLRHLSPLKPPRPSCRTKEIDTATLLELLTTLPKRSLMPQHDLASLQWLVKMAEQSKSEGELAKRAVESKGGKIIGWFVYYRRRNGIGRVLQLASQPRSMPAVLDSLIYEARQQGLAALWGRTEPEQAALMTERHCIFQGRPWVLVHAARPEIIRSFLEADAFFSGFEGEQWMKLNN
jgi:hypothetical protein